MDTSFTNTLENIAQAGRYDDVDWGSLTNAERARWLVTQHNAIRQVKEHVQNHGGFVSSYPCGNGLLEGIDRVLEKE